MADEATVRSLEPVGVNPTLDDHNRTAELAVELAGSALGKRILSDTPLVAGRAAIEYVSRQKY